MKELEFSFISSDFIVCYCMKRRNKTPESQVSNLQLFFFSKTNISKSPFQTHFEGKKKNKLKLMDIVFQNKANH